LRDIVAYFQKLNRSRDNDHAPFRDNLSSVGWNFAMFNPHSKFEMFTITCNEEMKGNAKCKNCRLEPPFGDLGNAQCSSMAQWKAHGRLPISDNWTFFSISHGCGTIKRNLSKSAFCEWGGSIWAQI